MGMLEFGRAFEVSQWLTASAREGARLAMLYNVISQAEREALGIPTANDKIMYDVKNFLRAARVNPSSVRVYITTPDGQTRDADGNPQEPPYFDLDDYDDVAGTYFKVRVEVPFEHVSYLRPTFLTGATLSGQIIVRHE
jgi:hypothetical protein